MPTAALCTAMPRARRAMLMASARRSSRSVVSTMSAASDEAVEPRAPIAIPTVAAARAGASLTPSPTMTEVAVSLSARTQATFPSGVCSACTQSSPSTVATSRAGSARSPVSMTRRCNPAFRSRLRVLGASLRRGSRSSKAPCSSPSQLTQAMAVASSMARLSATSAQRGLLSGSASLPTSTRLPSTMPLIPRPGCSDASRGGTSARCCLRACATMASARTCGDAWSSEAAIRSTSDASTVGAAMTSTTAGRPAVRVPVLSTITVVAWPRFSSAAPSRMITPIREARDMPDTIATGTAKSSGHGVATTSTATAPTGEPVISQAPPARSKARGRNHVAYRSARRTTGARSAPASRANRTIPV